jgi:hypothetical protein
VLLAMQANFVASFDLAAHVDFRRWVVADEYDGEAGTNSGGSHGFYFARHFTADIARHFGAIKNFCGQFTLLTPVRKYYTAEAAECARTKQRSLVGSSSGFE